jgi:hypothetical protein
MVLRCCSRWLGPCSLFEKFVDHERADEACGSDDEDPTSVRDGVF